ncbi:MAG TPA: helix-turn-helix transcriptional regulator [Rhizomicrobium sp.]|nr:helix-turn-helix transcriptional regulator [Rhizomicrobium sp.]
MAGLIGDVYESALHPDLWSRLATRVAGAFDSPSCVLVARSASRDQVQLACRTENFTAELSAAYEDYYYGVDFRAHRIPELGLSEVFLGEELMPEKDFEKSEFYRDYSKRLGYFYGVGSVFPDGAAIATFAIHRPRSGRAFDEQDRLRVKSVLPHISRALKVRRHLSLADVEQHIVSETLERAKLAALVVGHGGITIYANGQAETLLRQSDGLRKVGGKLLATSPAVSERLSVLIDGAEVRAAGGALLIPRMGRLPLTVLVVPFRPRDGAIFSTKPSAILFVSDPELSTPGADILQSLFGLTSTEAAVANALAGGRSIAEIAKIFRVSQNTVRTHIRSIFGKTGTNRQPELVSTILHSVAMLARK